MLICLYLFVSPNYSSKLLDGFALSFLQNYQNFSEKDYYPKNVVLNNPDPWITQF